MTASGIKLVDANIWLSLAFSDHVHHRAAVQWFDAQIEGTCAFCRLTQLALLRHLTNSTIMAEFVQSQQQAWNAYDGFIADPRVVFITEPPGIETEFRHLTQSSSPSHRMWTDAYLAAFAGLISATLTTFDRKLKSFHGLSVELLS